MNLLRTSALRRAAALATLAAAATLGLPALAAPHGGPDGMPMGGRAMQHMLKAADASAEQRAEIERIAAATRADLRAQHAAAQPLRQQMMELFTQPTVDANAAEVLRQQLMAERDRASQRAMQSMLEISRVLSPEQRQKVAAAMLERRERMRQRMEQHRQRHAEGAKR